MKQNEYSVLKSTRKQIVYGAAAQEVEIARFPAGTQLVVNATVDEAFNNTNTLSVGTNGSTANNIISGQAITSLIGVNATRRVITTENERIVTAKINASATAGAVTISVDYILPTMQEVSF
jgi:hypothetical protein